MGMDDPQPADEAMRFYQSLPDMAFLQARGLMPQQSQGFVDPFAAPEQGYVDPLSQPAVDPVQQERMYEDTILGGMKTLDHTAPDFHSKLQSYFSDHQDPYAAEYPRVRAAIESSLLTHKNLQTIFSRSPKLRAYYWKIAKKMSPDVAIPIAEQIAINEPKEPLLRGEYHSKIGALVNEGKEFDAADVSAELLSDFELAQNGIDPKAFVGKSLTERALEIAKLKRGQAVKIPITERQDKELFGLIESLDEARSLDTSSKSYIERKKKLIDEKKAKDWDEAHAMLVKSETEDVMKQLKRRVQSYLDANVAVPPDYVEAVGLPAVGYSFNQKGKPVAAGSPPVAPPAKTQTPNSTAPKNKWTITPIK